MPGHAVYELVPYRGGEPGAGTEPTLCEWRARLGGDEGEILDPLKSEMHHVSLASFADEHPDELRIAILWRFRGERRLTEDEVRQRLEPYRIL